MKALFLVKAFPPLNVSGSLRSKAFAEHLPAYGITPIVVCAEPDSAARIYPGVVGRIPDWEDDARWGGVTRIQWPNTTRGSAKWLSFGLRVPLAATYVQRRKRECEVDALFAAGLEAIVSRGADVIYCSVHPPSTALAGARLSKRFRLPLVVDIRDPWAYGPDRPYRHYVDFLLERNVERSALAQASLVVVPTRAAKEVLVRKLEVPADAVAVIHNGYETGEAVEALPLEVGVFTILHAGEISMRTPQAVGAKARIKRLLGIDFDPMRRNASSRSIVPVLSAFETFLNRRPELRNRVRMRFLGAPEGATKKLLSLTASADRILFDPRVPQTQADNMMGRADALLLMQVSYFLDGHAFCPAIPAKLYTYLSKEKPLIAVAQRSEIGELIASANAGYVIEPGDHVGLAERIEELVEAWRMGQDVRPHWVEKESYTRRALSGVLADRLREVVLHHQQGG